LNPWHDANTEDDYDYRESIDNRPTMKVLAEKWSQDWFEDRPVSEADLHSPFEAARWAASSYNEQAWNYD
jgi:nitroreductase